MVYKKRKSWFFCFEIREMYKNTLKYIKLQPTAEEITARKKMYKEAASLGIDLMGYDSNDSAIKRSGNML